MKTDRGQAACVLDKGGCCACVAAVFLLMLGQPELPRCCAQQQDALIERIALAAERKQDALRQMSATYSVKAFWPGDTEPYRVSSLRWVGQGNKVYVDADDLGRYGDRLQYQHRVRETLAYDGSFSRAFSPNDMKGTISLDRDIVAGGARSSNYPEALWAIGFVPGEGGGGKTTAAGVASMVKVVGDSQVQDVACLEIEVRPAAGIGGKRRLFLSKEHDFAPVQIEDWLPAGSSDVLHTRWILADLRTTGDMWCAYSGRKEHWGGADKLQVTEAWEVSALSTATVDDSLFTLVFPEGTRVTDLGTVSEYTIGGAPSLPNGGVVSELAREAAVPAAGVESTASAAVPMPGVERVGSADSTRLRWVYVLLFASAGVLVAAAVLARRGRAKPPR